MRKSVAFISLLLISGSTVFAHPRLSNPDLAELNDYLMALQELRHEHPRAAELFELWKSVREASWAIRRLTDERDLPSTDPKVVAQIDRTRTLRERLLKAARRYFSSLSSSLPIAQVEFSGVVDLSWPDPVIKVEVGSREVVLIQLQNRGTEPLLIDLFSDGSDQILFWEKSVLLSPQTRRFTFAYVAPSRSGDTASTIQLSSPDHRTQFRIRAKGLPTSLESPSVPEKKITFRIRDPAGGESLPVRVEVRSEKGEAYWEPLHGLGHAVNSESSWETPLWTVQPGPSFYIGGEAVLGVDPAGKKFRLYHGFEYEPAEGSVPDDGLIELAPRRWIDMPARGWYSGQTHIHTTDVGLPVPVTQFWPLISRAEDLAVSHILTLKGEWTTHAVYANEYPMGLLPFASTARHLVAYGQEYRNNPYGHLSLLRIRELIEPISSGALGELGGPDYPPNAFVLEAALAQNGITVGSHFGLSILQGKPIATPWPSTGYEMPVDVALGKLQIAEIYGNGGQQDVWYKLLNCGFELPATAGPDWVIRNTPRAYVHIGRDTLTLDRWMEGLQRGNNFITRGPMIFLNVDGQGPGARLNYAERPRNLQVTVKARMPKGDLPAEIVVNGEVVARGLNLDRSISLSDSSWIAARCQGAHTSPVYVTLQGRPRGSAKEAEEFIQVTDRLIEWVRTKGIFETDEQRNTVLNVLAQGRAVYETVAARASALR